MYELDPQSAVTAADPYPYYAQLVEERPFYRDKALGMWIASSAAAVEEVLASPVMRVRPPNESVPRALAQTPLSATFKRLVRTIDGQNHGLVKSAVTATFNSIDIGAIAATSECCANQLAMRLTLDDPKELASYVRDLPALAIATSLGLPRYAARLAVSRTNEIVRSLAPNGTPQDIARGVTAARALNDAIDTLLADPGASGSLFASFLAEGRRHGVEDDAILANTVGFLVQSYEATAALIANTLLELEGENAAYREPAQRDARLLSAIVDEIARYDAPVQNTRRFAAAATTIQGAALRGGDVVLVVLAAANRDPAANPQPHRFDPTRRERRTYTFGIGAHACPGARIATAIARVGVARLLESDLAVEWTAQSSYLPSLNLRSPDIASLAITRLATGAGIA